MTDGGACTLNLTPYAGTPGVCDHCGTALSGRQRRWCSPACSTVEFSAHDWASARKAARRRDGQKCVTCGSTGTYERPLEVNHIEPRVGKGYGMGCWNHLDNLETLCHDCHVAVTRQQRSARKAERLAREALAAEAAGLRTLDGLTL